MSKNVSKNEKKIHLREKCYKLVLTKISPSKFEIKILRLVTLLYENFMCFYRKLVEQLTIKMRHIWVLLG